MLVPGRSSCVKESSKANKGKLSRPLRPTAFQLCSKNIILHRGFVPSLLFIPSGASNHTIHQYYSYLLTMGSMISSVNPPFFYKSALLIMAAGKLWLWPAAAPLFDSWIPGTYVGVPLFLAGVHVALDSKRTFKQTGTPMMGKAASTSSPFHTSGYFAYTRNPMYLGISAALVGAALVTNCAYNLFFPVVNALIMNEYYVPLEERQLEEVFGAKYLKYKQTVPRWL